MSTELKICLVDDNSIENLILKQVIRHTNIPCNLMFFEHAENAIEFLESNKANKSVLPDIILLDINMPVMDGWDFLNAYKLMEDNFSKKMPIYMLTSSEDPSDISKAKSYSQVKDYLVKPLSVLKLQAVLKDIRLPS